MNDDVRLENLAQRLGTTAADRLDVEATARRVLERLRERPARRIVWIQQTWLRIAAALVIVLGGAAVVSRLPSGSGLLTGRHGAHFVADDLDDLSTDQLRDVLATLDDLVTGDSVAVPDSTDLRELDARQLRVMLRSLEG